MHAFCRLSSVLILMLAASAGSRCSSQPSKGANETCLGEECSAECIAAGHPGGECISTGCVCAGPGDQVSGDLRPGDTGALDKTSPDGFGVDLDVANDAALDAPGKDRLEDDGVDSAGPGTCSVDSVLEDCAPGEGCVEGLCGDCLDATTCPVGQGCMAGTCGPCESALECRPGEGCKGQICGPCTRPEQCREGEGCRDGLCGACVDAVDCFGRLCISGVCGLCPSTEACQQQYGQPYQCESGTCVRLSCAADSDCMFQGQLCDSVTFLCVDCNGTAACLESGAYGSGFQCLNGACSEGNCVESDDCPLDLPICGADDSCRGCLPTSQGPHGECLGKFGAGWLCLPQGTCVEGDCVSTKDCQAVNNGICAQGYQCRACLDPAEDAVCRTEYGLDSLVCLAGECVEGCTPGQACPSSGEVCGEDRRCAPCTTNVQCAAAYSDYLCIDGACKPAQCNLELECGMGLVCDSLLFYCRECWQHDECGDGAVCDLKSEGGLGHCYVGECTVATQSLCNTKLCSDFQCVSCGADHPCGVGRFCGADGVCLVGNCAIDSDCSGQAPMTCQKSVCVVNLDGSRTCGYEQLPQGTACDDGNICTSASACDSYGACLGTQQKCEDGIWCTINKCDPNSGACSIDVEPGTCFFATGYQYPECVYAGHTEDYAGIGFSNCRICDPLYSQTQWALNHGECSDGLFCTDDVCDGAGECTHTPAANTCYIDGACYNVNATKPGNVCMKCGNKNPGSYGQWENVASNSPCYDDGKSCTYDVCNGQGGCDHTAVVNTCFISGSCFMNGAVNPGNECQTCNANSPYQWTNKPYLTLCSDKDGSQCTVEKCDQGGNCVALGTYYPMTCCDGQQVYNNGDVVGCKYCDPLISIFLSNRPACSACVPHLTGKSCYKGACSFNSITPCK